MMLEYGNKENVLGENNSNSIEKEIKNVIKASVGCENSETVQAESEKFCKRTISWTLNQFEYYLAK